MIFENFSNSELKAWMQAQAHRLITLVAADHFPTMDERIEIITIVNSLSIVAMIIEERRNDIPF